MAPKRTKSIPDASALKGMWNELDDAMADVMGQVKDPDVHSRSSSHSSNPFTDDDSSSSEEEPEEDISEPMRGYESIRIRSKKPVDRF